MVAGRLEGPRASTRQVLAHQVVSRWWLLCHVRVIESRVRKMPSGGEAERVAGGEEPGDSTAPRGSPFAWVPRLPGPRRPWPPLSPTFSDRTLLSSESIRINFCSSIYAFMQMLKGEEMTGLEICLHRVTYPSVGNAAVLRGACFPNKCPDSPRSSCPKNVLAGPEQFSGLLWPHPVTMTLLHLDTPIVP